MIIIRAADGILHHLSSLRTFFHYPLIDVCFSLLARLPWFVEVFLLVTEIRVAKVQK